MRPRYVVRAVAVTVAMWLTLTNWTPMPRWVAAPAAALAGLLTLVLAVGLSRKATRGREP
jgi:F0F1-type ATP synthase membrane subunit a